MAKKTALMDGQRGSLSPHQGRKRLKEGEGKNTEAQEFLVLYIFDITIKVNRRLSIQKLKDKLSLQEFRFL